MDAIHGATQVDHELPGRAGDGMPRSPEVYPADRWLSKSRFLLPSGIVVLMIFAAMLYLKAFGYQKGLDTKAADFKRYFYPIAAFDVIVLTALTFALVRLTRSRCATCTEQRSALGEVEPHHELKHLWIFLSILFTAVLPHTVMPAIGAAGDAAWHQSVLRDSAITPIHLFNFYLFAPIGFLALLGSYVYAATRLEDQWGAQRGVPISYLIFGVAGAISLFNFTFNEFGHSLWIFEELFTHPSHWPFIITGLGWTSAFAIAARALLRARQLLDTVEARCDLGEDDRPLSGDEGVAIIGK